MSQAAFTLKGRNPDVLTCIANLSNDEVFTPPELAQQMLDNLERAWAEVNNGSNIWGDRTVTFLDPFTKSGVFLREIVKRLTDGLAGEIPDLTQRVDHILTRQVYGIGITSLTSLLARRSLYCSKYANGPHSVAKSFTTEQGNVWFQRTEHTWTGGTKRLRSDPLSGKEIVFFVGRRCSYCGASEGEYSRDDNLETHAYAFIHTDEIRTRVSELFGGRMQFDVIIGNPPYQLGSDGGTRDVPIYQKFVEQAKRLDPRFLSMVIPARWMASGLGLTDFRQTMLADRRLRALTDYPVSKELFPSVEVKGGICYFLWDRDFNGDAEVTSIRDGNAVGPHKRDLREFDVLVRDYRAVKILRKVLAKKEPSITAILSVDKEFGWTSNFTGFHERQGKGDVPLYYGRQGKRSVGYIKRSEINKSENLVDFWKVMIPKAGSDGGQRLPDGVLGRPFIAPSPSVCTQTYLFFYVESEKAATSVQTYLSTRFFRFLVSLRKLTQDATRSTYTWVPKQSWNRSWTDELLYAKYGITKDEIAFIESMVREMDIPDE